MRFRSLIALFMTLCAACLLAQEAEPPTLIVDRETDLGALPVETTEIERIRSILREHLAKLPEGMSLRLTLTERWSNHPAHYGMNAYPKSIVPLDSKGRPHGTEYVWGGERDGDREVPWVHGEKHGVERVWKGRRENRWLAAEIPWRHGKQHGRRVTYHAADVLHTQTLFVDGLATGMSRTFDRDGNLQREAPMRAGERHGETREYWRGGEQLKRAIPYSIGKVDGVVRDFYANGQLKQERTFRDNALHGRERQFEATGELIRERWWVNGEIADEAVFEAADE